MGELFAICQNTLAISDVTPLEDFDLDVSDSPFVHGRLGGFVEVDGVGTREGPSVVVNDEMFAGVGDSEGGSCGPAGPVSGGAVDFWTKLQVGTEGVLTSVRDVIGL